MPIDAAVDYSSLAALKARFDRTARRCAFRAADAAGLELWRTETRRTLGALIGLDRLELCEGGAELLERVELADVLRERWRIRTEPGVWMPFYVLKPAAPHPAGRKPPALIAPHGHGVGGKAGVAGALDAAEAGEREGLGEAVRRHNNDYGLQLARAGFVVFCPDARGAGERREPANPGTAAEGLLECSCRRLSQMALGLGLTVTGLWVWDLMRLLDHVAAREDCDGERIGCAGFSGGGLQTLWLSALDERVRCAVVSGYLYGYRDSLLELNGNCACNYVPGLWETADMGDIAALVAPRPLLVETGRGDPLNGERGAANAQEQTAVAAAAYRVSGAPDALEHRLYEGGHRWYGTDVIPFLRRHLG